MKTTVFGSGNRRHWRVLFGALLLAVYAFGLPLDATALTLTRGPYLQLGTQSSIVVRWRTETATNSRVRYGTDPSNLSSVVDDSTSTTEHLVKLTGLNPSTKYYYSLGHSAATLAGGASHFFVTAPTPGTEQPTHIWVAGNSGTENAKARAVRDAYLKYKDSRYTHLWLILGDNAYQNGTDSDYQGAVFNTYPTLLRQTVLWPTLGRHDGITADSASQSGAYYDTFTLPKQGEAGGMASGTEAYYSFDYANIHFVVLDSIESSKAPAGAMLTWLKNDLAATTQPWIIAYWYHPPYSKGSHDSDTETALREMRENALPILEDAGVDLVLNGHSGSYDRSFLIDGHYGSSGTFEPKTMLVDGGDGRIDGTGEYQKSVNDKPVRGTVYTVVGGSGETRRGSSDHPVMRVSLNALGSMVLDVNGPVLDAAFLDDTGQVRDRFSMVKTTDTAKASTSAPDVPTTEPNPTPQTAKVSPNLTAAVASTYTVSAPSTVAPGGTITVSYTAPSNHSTTDWVSIFNQGAADTAYNSWKQVPSGTSGTLTLTASNRSGNPLPAGTYEVRYYLNDGFTRAATSNNVTVSSSSDITAPSTPTALTAAAVSSSQVNLSWNVATDNVGVTGYRIFRCQGTGCTPVTQIDTTFDNSYSDRGLSANTTHVYQLKAHDAANNLSSGSAIVSATTLAGSSSQIPTPTQTPPIVNVKNFGVKGDGVTNDTAAIQRALDSMTNGGTLVFPPGTYKYTSALGVTRPGTKLWGYGGATLHNGVSTVNAITLAAANTAIYGFKLTTAPITRGSGVHAQIGLRGGPGQEAIDNRLVGPANLAGLGIMAWGASDFLIARNHVEKTAADAIWMVGGSRNGKVLENVVRDAGDDMVGVVSTIGWPINYNILIERNDVAQQFWGRGISVVGGKDVTIRNNTIAHTYAAAGIIITQEDNFNTWEVRNILVEGNKISHVQTTGTPKNNFRTHHAGIHLWAENSGKRVENVMLRNNVIDNVITYGIAVTSNSCKVGMIGNRMTRIPSEAMRITTAISSSCNVACSGNTDEGQPVSNSRCGGPLPSVTGYTP